MSDEVRTVKHYLTLRRADATQHRHGYTTGAPGGRGALPANKTGRALALPTAYEFIKSRSLALGCFDVAYLLGRCLQRDTKHRARND